MNSSSALHIGWAETDITPEKPALLTGQFHARLSEGVLDPLKTTALALQSGDEQAVMVCCDLVSISDLLRDSVREKIRAAVPDLDPQKVVINATHSHNAPEIRVPDPIPGHTSANRTGVEGLDAISTLDYVEFAASRIADAVAQAWQSRATGGVAYGLGYAVLARNRRWVNKDGVATMHGVGESTAEIFDYVEGFEDHSVNLLATYDDAGVLTGLIINTPCTAQQTDSLFQASADLWHEARQELRRRFGENIFILTQVSAAGDLTPIQLYEKAADKRMLELKNRSAREEAAQRIARSVEEIVPFLQPAVESAPVLKHVVETVELPLNALSEADVEQARKDVAQFEAQYKAELQKLEENPALREEPRWYVPVTKAYRLMHWHYGVITRYEQLKTQPTREAEVHVIRLGDIVFATNPFEYYLDYGVRIKVKSPAIQTFLVELAGPGSYIPSLRSVKSGGYGSVPASNPVGPEGGQVLEDETMRLIRSLWN